MSATNKSKNANKAHSIKKIEDISDSIWSDNKIDSANNSLSKEPWCIMMPPPNVTGHLHIGHALNMTLQDVLTRFWRMNARNVFWQPGTDHAGIATQMVVERDLLEKKNLSRKKMGREKFLNEVWKWKEISGGQILKQLKRLGASANWSRERFTLDEGLSNAVKKVFIKLFNDKLIYRDKRLVNWDTKLQTAISDLEVIQKEEKGNSWHFKYPIENTKQVIVVATTRPETMLGDTAVAVNPDDKRYKKLIGKNIVMPITNRKIPIVADKYADPEKGTGAVKITPAHDFNDFEVGRTNNLQVINILNSDGSLNDNVPAEYRGLDRLDVRDKIVSRMKEMGCLDKVEETIHFVPYGDRSDTIIEPYLTDQWFIDAKTLSIPAVEAVKKGKTIFIPKTWENTYFDWMKNIEPWCISRQLWWGHRIPAWFAEDGNFFVAESEEEAKKLAMKLYKKDVDLRQDPDVLDTWFSSGLWPFSTLGWPDSNDYLKKYYPGNSLVTGFDIIFFWVARMMMLGIYCMKEPPFKEVYVHGLIRDSRGQKMSKSKGNVIDPIILMDKYGADSLRFTLVSLATYGRDIKLSEERIVGYRNFITKITNASRFLKMNNCKLYSSAELDFKLPVNKWINFHLAKTSFKVSQHIKVYRFNEAANTLYQFIWHKFCDWYLEIIKPILLDEKNEFYEETKKSCAHVFSKILCILHPFVPFHTEYLYTKIHNFGTCLALEKWPDLNDAYEYNDGQIDWIIKFISEIRSLRDILNIPHNQLIYIEYKDRNSEFDGYINNNLNIIKKLSNVDRIRVTNNAHKQSAQMIIDDRTYYIPLEGVIDIDTELERLKKELSKINDEVLRIDEKLSNEGFIKNAPEQVIKEQNDKKNQLELTKNSITVAVDRLIDV